MNILITGATGFIGSHLVFQLIRQGHNVTALVRNKEKAQKMFQDNINYIVDLSIYNNLNNFDAVINLAGEPIFNHSWNTQQKKKLIDSRINITKNLTALINQSSKPPHTFISGSATGYYDSQNDQVITENTTNGTEFTAQLCAKWEKTALQANTRVCLLRTGIVLSKSGGALQKMLPIYRWGLGGRLGNGEQYWAWIALEDMLNGILFLLNNPQCRGVFNLSSPNPVKNKIFNQILGRLLKRPYFVSVPSFILKWILGERSQLLLNSQRVMPEKLIQCGFKFHYATLQEALKEILI
ncbi:hypothetical protein EV697_10235 [Bisgaardia hudsonensis]|uniref:TIGR01777 family protein n=1 Tax=Bisgaardia hudsonensis TaxID=109472 RepID=A0A4R2N0X6_9PAST|nr:TIGR01777 family oxidoreductase [Bisgaardia hudsonensis]QLB13254.1 TIGR01777 family protein [Bisgaardia hudsonensis]TCP13164.1 hypothetical protein EV697_10235 [Bisgaardia hudsonensis]